MPMNMGIHCKPIGHSHSTSLDSRVRGNDGGIFFPRKRLSNGCFSMRRVEKINISRILQTTDEK